MIKQADEQQNDHGMTKANGTVMDDITGNCQISALPLSGLIFASSERFSM